ncbi:MAG: KUP/HAK/KT family potassium transporter [Sphingobacteriia bacterium]|nr:KUP/HAK/KT family potassium transporter [Sphingobacteriia bacterium]
MTNKTPLKSLIIGAIGIVYGDIGTSPLYALKNCFLIGNLPVNDMNILGLISMFIWTLFLVVTIKYVCLILTINNQGEGGTLVISSLCRKLKIGKYRIFPLALGIIATSLFFGEGIITPAISVLSALEGIEVISPSLEPYIMPFSLVILTLLFFFQKHGTGKIGLFFGPIMVLWFITLSILGIYNIFQMPEILKAFNPYYIVNFMINNGFTGLLTIGGIILVITGVEALYADLGHFDRFSISLSWHLFIFPALILNYLGQGALLLNSPEAITNPFYHLVPETLLYPLIIFASIATIIASQSVISGVFSIAWQATLRNYLPKMKVVFTSSKMGQVYLPVVNYILYFLTIGAVLKFKTSENLAVAYGLSVAGVMLISTILAFLLAWKEWKWNKFKLGCLFIPLFFLDTTFVLTNFIKLFEGAWYTVLISAIVTYTITVWIKGNALIKYKNLLINKHLDTYLPNYQQGFPIHLPHTAIFMSKFIHKIPNSLLIHLKHNKLLHNKIIFISICPQSVPRVSLEKKFTVERININWFRILVNVGFKEIIDFDKMIEVAREHHILGEQEEVSIFFSRSIPISSTSGTLNGFSERFYIFLYNNALSPHEFYKIPHDQVVELGVRFQI